MPTNGYFTQNWKRYLDDCLIIWPGSEDSLKKLHSIINKIHRDIQFTLEMLPFLDILIKKVNTEIETNRDIHYTPTDSKQYLLFKSCHPNHKTANLPYNLTRRICTIVSIENQKEKRLEELKNFLRYRLYPTSLIETGMKKVKEIEKQTLRQPKQQSGKKVISFVITNNPRNPDVYNMFLDQTLQYYRMMLK